MPRFRPLAAGPWQSIPRQPEMTEMDGAIFVDLGSLGIAFFAGFAVRAYISYRRRLRGS